MDLRSILLQLQHGMKKVGPEIPPPDEEKSALENLDLVAVWIRDKRHFAPAGGEFFTPAGRPDFDAGFFDAVAVSDDVVHPECGVHQVFGAGGFVIFRPGEFEKNLVSGELEEGELVALRRRFALFFGVAEFFVKRDGGIKALNTDAGMEETDHGGGAWNKIRWMPIGD